MQMTNDLVKIEGNTFPVKDKLKALGARFNYQNRGKFWFIAPRLLEQAQAIVAGQASRPAGLVGALMSAEGSAVVSAVAAILWSPEQEAIFEWFKNGLGNLVVQARAGTGKTTTIKEAFTRVLEVGRFLYAVFNKKNQREAEEKIRDPRVEVRTLHSLGFLFIKLVWKDATPDDDVEFDRIRALVAGAPDEIVALIGKLVGFAKNLTIGIPSEATVLDIADQRSILPSDELAKDWPVEKLAGIAIEAMKAALVKDPQGRVSFADMVWLPVAAGWVHPLFDLTVVDEAQDMNLPQLEIAIRATKSTGRICIVGDNRQAIYGFRGAASDGMAMMKDRLNAKELGLTVTYRCPAVIVDLAKEIVPDYTAAPGAPQGEVLNMNLDAAIETLKPGDAVLSRLNAPLMNIALGLIRRQIPARIEGRDIGKQLVKRVQKLKAKSVPDYLKKLANWASKQTARISAAGGKYVKSKIEQVQDELLTLQAVAEGCQNVAEIEARIIGLFEDSDKTIKPAVVLSSVHKAKGLEWNKVCLVASTFKHKGSEGEEANIYYVAVTRAKKTLVFGA